MKRDLFTSRVGLSRDILKTTVLLVFYCILSPFKSIMHRILKGIINKGQNLLTCIAHCFQTKSVLSFNKSSQNPNKSPLSYFLDRRITFLATIRADPSARIGSRDVILLLRKQLRGLLLGDWLLLLELRTDFVWKHWAMQLSKF